MAIWYDKILVSQIQPHQPIDSAAITALPQGYVIRRDQEGGWTVLNPDQSVLVESEKDPLSDEKALRRAIRLAILRINHKLSSHLV